MEQTGSLTVYVTTSRAQLPIEGAAVVITEPASGGTFRVLSVLKTDGSGLAGPIVLRAPSGTDGGTTPGGAIPYNLYSLWVEHPGYELVRIDSLQIFPNVHSLQSITLVPLSGTASPGGEGSPSLSQGL